MFFGTFFWNLVGDNDYHLHITTCVEPIKPRQIINYDAGIVLIDLHQLFHKNNFEQYKSATLKMQGNLMSTKNRTRRTTTRNIRFLTIVEQKLTSLLSKKRVRNFSAWVIEAAVGDSIEERHVIESDEEWYIPRSSLRTGRYCKFT